MMIEDVKHSILCGNKSILRGGVFLFEVFEKPSKHLSGEEALQLFNTYGIPVKSLTILIASHRFTFDEDQFCELLEKQEERFKNSIQCIV